MKVYRLRNRDDIHYEIQVEAIGWYGSLRRNMTNGKSKNMLSEYEGIRNQER